MEVRKLICDCCGSDKEVKHYRTLVKNYIEHTEGRSIDTPYASEEEMDLCPQCAMNATNLEEKGACCSKIAFNYDEVRRYIIKWLYSNASTDESSRCCRLVGEAFDYYMANKQL